MGNIHGKMGCEGSTLNYQDPGPSLLDGTDPLITASDIHAWKRTIFQSPLAVVLQWVKYSVPFKKSQTYNAETYYGRKANESINQTYSDIGWFAELVCVSRDQATEFLSDQDFKWREYDDARVECQDVYGVQVGEGW